MIKSLSNICVVIPSNHNHEDLIIVIKAINNQIIQPAEIVIVDSSFERGKCPAEISALCAASGIKLIYEHRTSALPGEARNIGISRAGTGLIALLDVETIPRPDWLEKSLRLLSTVGVLGVWGSTYFSADNKFERLVRDGLFGIHPRKTLPGSVFRREVFKKAGEFIDWVRAGEDTEWMLRVEVLKIRVLSTTHTVDYTGLIGSDAMQLMKKWHRNYTMSRELPHLFPQKLLLWLIFYPMLILIAFNWNYLIADWRMDSPLYLGHVTKIMATLPIFIYVITRGVVMPLKRGVGVWRLLPARFLMITSVCLIADFVKILVFSSPKLKRDVPFGTIR
jgi:hypothetical protein